MSSHFNPISTCIHIAPSSRMILANIVKVQNTIWVLTAPNERMIPLAQQVAD